MRKPSKQVVVAVVLAASAVLYGARAAAFFDPGANAMLAELLANASQQLSVAMQSLSELRRSYAEAKKVAEYADDAVSAARSFQRGSAQQFGDRFLNDLEALQPDLERYRRDALGGAGLAGSDWARGTGTLQRLSTYCLSSGASARQACVQLRGQLENTKVMAALAATFGKPGLQGADQAKVVDSEVVAAIQGDAAQARTSALQKARVRELLRQCNAAGDAVGNREAKRIAEECRAAAEQAQLLHLEEGQETNAKLAQIARLQALGVEQKNADLKRDLGEQAARRSALTEGMDALTTQRMTIRSGGLAQ